MAAWPLLWAGGESGGMAGQWLLLPPPWEPIGQFGSRRERVRKIGVGGRRCAPRQIVES